MKTSPVPQRLFAFLVTAFVVLSGCKAPRPTVRFSEQPWSRNGLAGTHITTEHFDVYSTLHDDRLTHVLPEFLEGAYRQYSALLPRDETSATRLNTYLFGSRHEWDAFARENFAARHAVYQRIRSGGFTEGATAVVLHKSTAATLATLAHEGFHQYFGSSSFGPIPAWLNEGLACYFEGYEFVRGTVYFTPLENTFRVTHLRNALSDRSDTGLTSGRLFTLSEITDIDAGEVLAREDSRLTQTYYAQLWGLITFLRHSEHGRHADAFDQMIADLREGTLHVRAGATKLTFPNAVTMTYGRSVFAAYFGDPEGDLADAYHRHLMNLAGFRISPVDREKAR